MSCAKCWVPSITDYIGFYEDIIPDDVCDKIMAHDWGMRKSTYSNNDGKSKTSDEISKSAGNFGIPGFKWPL